MKQELVIGSARKIMDDEMKYKIIDDIMKLPSYWGCPKESEKENAICCKRML